MNDLNNLANCCRLCLNQTIYLSVFDSNYDYLQQKILACLNIEVREFDKISIMICQRCLLKIEDFYEYRILCQKSQYTLFNWLNSYEGHSSYQNISSEIQIDEDQNFVDNVQIKQEPLPAPEDSEILNEEPLTVEDCPYEYVDVSQNFNNDFYRNSNLISTETLQMVESDNFLIPSSECEVSNHGVDDDTICQICKKKFCSSSSRFRHEKNVHKENQNEFLEPLNLKPKDSKSGTFLNTTKVDPLNYIPCKYCPKNFKKRLNLLKHEKTIHKNKKTRKLYIREPNPDPKTTNDPLNIIYVCNFCPKTFMSLENRIEHEKSHQEQNFKPLPKIQKLGKQSKPTSKTSHFGPDTRLGSLGIRADHSSSKLGTFDSKTSNLNKKLNNFSRKTENLLQQNLREISDQNLDSVSSKLNKHLTEEELKFSCKSCDKTFKNKKALIWHEEHSHRKIRLNLSLTCSFCPKTFRNLGNKLQHEKFKHKKELARKRHKKIIEIPKIVPVPENKIETETTEDAEEFPFSCKLCPKKFALLKTQKRHEKIHHGMITKHKNESTLTNVSVSEIQAAELETPENKNWGVKLTFDCKICLRKFRTLQKLLSHEKHYHKNEPEPEPEPKNGSLLEILDPISEISCQYCQRKFTASSGRKRHEKYCDKRQKIPKIKIKGVPTLIETERENPVTETFVQQDEGPKIEYSKPKSKILNTKSKFKCQFCSKSFKSYKNKRSHERSHKITKRPSLRSNVITVSEEIIPDNSESPNNDSFNESLTNENKPSLRYFRSKRAINSENQFNPALKRSKSDCSEPNEGIGDTHFEMNDNLDQKPAELLNNSDEKCLEKLNSEKSLKGSETLNSNENQGLESLNSNNQSTETLNSNENQGPETLILNEYQGSETLTSNENQGLQILNLDDINRSKLLNLEKNFPSKSLNLNENQGSESLNSEDNKRSESLNYNETEGLERLNFNENSPSKSSNLYENMSSNSDEYLHLASFSSEQYKRSESLKWDKNLHSKSLNLNEIRASKLLNLDENQGLELVKSDKNQGSKLLNLDENQGSELVNSDEIRVSKLLNLDENKDSELVNSDENQGLESLNSDKNQGLESLNSDGNQGLESWDSNEIQGWKSLNSDKNQASISMNSDENKASILLNLDGNDSSKSLNSEVLDLHENSRSELPNLDENQRSNLLISHEQQHSKLYENQDSESLNYSKNLHLKSSNLNEKYSESLKISKMDKTGPFESLVSNSESLEPETVLVSTKDKNFGSSENNLEKFSNSQIQKVQLNSSKASILVENDKKLSCKVCNNLFSTLSEWADHQKIHLKCFDCSESFTSSVAFFEHQKKHHRKIKKNDSYYCQSCNKNFKSSNALYFHRKKHHLNKSLPNLNCISEKYAIFDATLTVEVKNENSGRIRPHSALGRLTETFKLDKIDRKFHQYQNDGWSPLDVNSCQNIFGSVKNNRLSQNRSFSTLGKLSRTFELNANLNEKKLCQKDREPYVNSCHKMSETVRTDRSSQKMPSSALGVNNSPDQIEDKLLFDTGKCQETVINDIDTCQKVSESVKNDIFPENKNSVGRYLEFPHKKFSSKSEPDLNRSPDFVEMLTNQGLDHNRLNSGLEKSSESFQFYKNDINRDQMSFSDNDSCHKSDISSQNKSFDRKFSSSNSSSCNIYRKRNFSRSEPNLSTAFDISVTFDRSRPPLLENMAKCQNCDFLASSPIQLDAHLKGCKIDSSLNRSMPDLTKFDDEKSFQLKVVEKKY